MEPLITWDDLGRLIAIMSPKLRSQPVLSKNTQTGAYFGFLGIDFSDSEDNPPDVPVLQDDDNWYYINNRGEPSRSRYQPHPEDMQ